MSVVKYHKHNTNFQIAHFLAGACHTPDAAYYQLLELKEDRLMAVDNYNVVTKRNNAKKNRIENALKSGKLDVFSKEEAEADLLEIENNSRTSKIHYDAAMDEIKYIEHCIEIIKPMCQYVGKLTDIEAHEAMQADEWKFELIRRAENHLITSGTIPAGEFQTMRMHPAFKTDIYPRIKEVQSALRLIDGKHNDDEIKRLEDSLTGSKFMLLDPIEK